MADFGPRIGSSYWDNIVSGASAGYSLGKGFGVEGEIAGGILGGLAGATYGWARNEYKLNNSFFVQQFNECMNTVPN